MEVALEWAVGRGWRSFEAHARKSPDYPKEIVGRNMDIKGISNDISDRNEEHVIEYWRKGDPCYKMAKKLVELCSCILCKVKFINYEFGYLVEISRQSAEDAAWFLFVPSFFLISPFLE